MEETFLPVSDLLFPLQYRGKVLALLLLHPEQRWHVREIARLTSTAPGTMSKELARLHRSGLLLQYRSGNQVLFAANANHPVYPELSALLKKTLGLSDVLRNALAPLADRIRVAFVFGSVARGTESTTSDIDVMLIGDVSFGEAVELLYPAQGTLHREVNPRVFTATEWQEKLASKSTFVQDVIAKPKIFLMGAQDDLDQLGELGTNRPD